VPFTPEDFRQRLEEHSDAGLLSIDRQHLTEIARQIYDQEVTRRGLTLEPTPERTEALRGGGAEPVDELVHIATFVYPPEAKFARAQLEGEGIPCFLVNERTLDIDWFLTNVVGGYRLFVPASYAEQARAILGSQVSDEELAAQAEAAGPAAE
jgi:hypothetical protein